MIWKVPSYQKQAWLVATVLTAVFPAFAGAAPFVVLDQGPEHEVLDVMRLVGNWQIAQSNHDDNNNWERGALFAGITAAHEATKDAVFRDDALAWSQSFGWNLGSRPRHADDHCCAQTYLELYLLDSMDPVRYADAQATFDYIIDNPVTFVCDSNSKDFWQWCDALFMAPPVLPRLSAITGDGKYNTLLHTMWADTQGCLYDTEDHLFYRDHNFFDDRIGGEKVFWSRGNGWVMGGVVRVLEFLPHDDPQRGVYVTLFQEMSAKLATLQGVDGFWRSNLLYPAQYPNPESSGTAFFCYAMAWGVNRGLLDAQTYGPVIEAAWDGMVNVAVHPDGKLGYVQQVGSAPAAASYDDTQFYAVGAFLLAGSEMYKYYQARESVWLENFESYHPDDPNQTQLDDAWTDGSTNGTTSSISLYGIANQAMQLSYENTLAPYYAECARLFAAPLDLTADGMSVLTFYVKGATGNSPELLSITLVDAFNQTSTQQLTDASWMQDDNWSEINVSLNQFSGIDLTQITSIRLRIGPENPVAPGTGAGTVWIDDLRLQPPICLENSAKVADWVPDCRINYLDFAYLAGDWMTEYGDIDPVVEPNALHLTCYYPLDESAGSVVPDASGQANDGQAFATAWDDSGGKFDGAIAIQGTVQNDSRVDILVTAIPLAAGTVAFWAYLEPDQTFTSTRYFFAHIKPVGQSEWGNRIQLYMDGSNTQLDLGMGDTHALATNIAVLSVQTWYHIALSWDGTNYTVYLDGIEKAAGTYSGLSETQTANIGNDASAIAPDEPLNGKIDEFRIYDYVLSAGEIGYLAQVQSLPEVENPLPTDLNVNGTIDVEDLLEFAGYWLTDFTF